MHPASLSRHTIPVSSLLTASISSLSPPACSESYSQLGSPVYLPEDHVPLPGRAACPRQKPPGTQRIVPPSIDCIYAALAVSIVAPATRCIHHLPRVKGRTIVASAENGGRHSVRHSEGGVFSAGREAGRHCECDKARKEEEKQLSVSVR